MTSLEERIAALETEVGILKDREAIQQLVANYGPLADTANDADGRALMGTLFAEHGVYDLGAGWEATGPTAIGELLNNSEHIGMVNNGCAHVMGLPYITVDGDRGTALSYSRVYRHNDGEFHLWRVSANLWECERINGQWKVARRTNRLINGDPAARELLRRGTGHSA